MLNERKNWLITGGAGFIGRRLCHYLLENNQSVRVLDNFKTVSKESFGEYFKFETVDLKGCGSFSDEFQLLEGDITDPMTPYAAALGADIIVHLAANTGVQPSIRDPFEDFQNNCFGTFNCLEAARQQGVRKFVYASSGAVVGAATPPLHEELPTKPMSPYGASKACGEGYCCAYYQSFGIETVALRFGNVYGPYSSHKESVVAKLIKQALSQTPWEIYGDGEQTRDFIYIDDIVAAIVLSGVRVGVAGEVFQIATNTETSVNNMCKLLLATLDKYGIRGLEILNAKALSGDARRNFSDVSKASKKLGWKAQMDLEAGLNATVEWALARL